MDKKLNNYELVIIMSASLEDNELDVIQKRYEEYFSVNNIEMVEIEKLGRKRMAYQIKKIRTGYYLICRFNSTGDFISRMERTLELDEQILRYLTVKLDKRAIEYRKKVVALTPALVIPEIDDSIDLIPSIDDIEPVVKL